MNVDEAHMPYDNISAQVQWAMRGWRRRESGKGMAVQSVCAYHTTGCSCQQGDWDPWKKAMLCLMPMR